MTIDTSRAALCKLADEYLGDYENTKVMRDTLLAIAAEKEAQAQKEPVAWAIGYGGKPLYLWHGGDGARLDLEVKRQGGDSQKMALYTAPQHHCEQPLEMVAPADVQLPEPDLASDFTYDAHVYGRDKLHQYAEAYAKAAVAAERERCAKIAETPVAGEQDDITMAAKDRVAAAIREAQKGTV